MDRHGERAKRLIRADVGGRLLTADVLLACGECEYVAAPPFGVHRFAGEPPGELPHKFVTRGDHAGVRPAKTRREAETLRFHRYAVRSGRRPHRAQRATFCNRGAEQRFPRMRTLRYYC